MKKFLLILCLSVCPVFAQNATPFCTSMSARVHVTALPGKPNYITKYSREEFLKKVGNDVSPYTLGLTVSKLDVHIEATPSISKQLDKYCVSLENVEIELKNVILDVYIDKKYKPSTCEYKTIKSHENYHVAVAQQALVFFKSDIEKAAAQALRGISPQIVYSTGDIQNVALRQVNIINNALKPVIAHINQKLNEKDKAIDTPEMYRKTSALCNNW